MTIKPVSDLRNYNEVLAEVGEFNPVYLTENGKQKYVILDLEEYERQLSEMKRIAEEKLFEELETRRKCGEYYTIEEVDKELGL